MKAQDKLVEIMIKNDCENMCCRGVIMTTAQAILKEFIWLEELPKAKKFHLSRCIQETIQNYEKAGYNQYRKEVLALREEK